MRTCARFPRRRWQLALAASVIGVGLAGAAQAQAQAPARAPTSTLRLVSETPYAAQGVVAQAPAMTAEQLRDTAIDAYVYAYPMVLMEMTRRASTNVQTPIAGRAPMNQFGHRTAFPDPRATDVAWPSTDTLSSSLWYDVSREPLIVQVPAAGERYYLLSMLDMWTDAYASRGTRTTGGGAQTFAIVGPYWQGALPPGVDMVRSPTGSGWMIARVQTGGPDDYQNVNQFQAALTVTPLAQWGKPFRMTGSATVNPAWSAQQSPAEQVAAMDAASYFNLFADLLRSNPPHANDYPMLDRLRRLGLGDQPNAFARLDPAVQQALIETQPLAGRRIADAAGRLGTQANGWNTALHGIGTYGTDYLRRAAVAYVGLGANPPRRRALPGDGRRCARQGAAQRRRLRAALRQGPAAAGQCLLVADPVRRAPGAGGQPDRPLCAAQHRPAGLQRRRLAGYLHPARSAAQGAAGELAAGAAPGRLHAEPAPVLAARHRARRPLGAAARARGLSLWRRRRGADRPPFPTWRRGPFSFGDP